MPHFFIRFRPSKALSCHYKSLEFIDRGLAFSSWIVKS